MSKTQVPDAGPCAPSALSWETPGRPKPVEAGSTLGGHPPGRRDIRRANVRFDRSRQIDPFGPNLNRGFPPFPEPRGVLVGGGGLLGGPPPEVNSLFLGRRCVGLPHPCASPRKGLFRPVFLLARAAPAQPRSSKSSWWKRSATGKPTPAKSLRSAAPKPGGPQNQIPASRHSGASTRTRSPVR